VGRVSTGLEGQGKGEEQRKGEGQENEEQIGEELTRMIGFATAVASLDMTLVFEICDRASYSEHCAKQAAKALRRELKSVSYLYKKYFCADNTSLVGTGNHPARSVLLGFGGSWVQNCANTSITQTSSRKFLDTLEDLITGSRTPPLVRDALLNALRTAVYICTSRGT